MKRVLGVSLLAFALNCHAATDMENAMLAYERGHYAAAFKWFDLAARNGRQASRYMMCAMLRHADDARPKGWHCFDWVAETRKPAPR